MHPWTMWDKVSPTEKKDSFLFTAKLWQIMTKNNDLKIHTSADIKRHVGQVRRVHRIQIKLSAFRSFLLSVDSPWGRGGPRPSGGNGAQPLGSAECNDCMQTPGGHGLVTSYHFTVGGCELALTLRELPVAMFCRATLPFPPINPAAIIRGALAKWFDMLPQKARTGLYCCRLLSQHGQSSAGISKQKWC